MLFRTNHRSDGRIFFLCVSASTEKTKTNSTPCPPYQVVEKKVFSAKQGANGLTVGLKNNGGILLGPFARIAHMDGLAE